jgi:hypothetical protein
VRTAAETFGISGAELASEQIVDPSAAPSPVATTRVRNDTPLNPVKALLDPSGSAIFWIALAAVLGLILISGQVRLDAKLGGRAGRGRR